MTYIGQKDKFYKKLSRAKDCHMKLKLQKEF